MRKKIIMVVDDEPHIVELIKAILENANFEVVVAYDGSEALEKLKIITPDLITLDMMMPGMSGRKVFDKIRANPKTKNIKIIFLTVSNIEGVILDRLNISDYIQKPFDLEDLVKRINTVLE